jgi:hypothetical protein
MSTTIHPLLSGGGPQSLDAQKLALARDLLDDIELSRLAPEQLLLKASRLARLLEDGAVLKWLEYELRGYYDSSDHLAFAERVGRVLDKVKKHGYWAPLTSLDAQAQATQIQIQQLKVPNISFAPSSANPHEYVTGVAGSNVSKLAAPAEIVLARLQLLTTTLAQLREIQSRVIAEIHQFVVQTYHRLAFSGAAENIFLCHQREVDTLLRDNAGDVLQKIPTICSRLSESDPEAISQALSSCRRMIKAFADAVQPPEDHDVETDGVKYHIGSDKVLNRIQYFLGRYCSSRGRRDRIIKNLRQINDRVAKGVHTDITTDEAKALFLQTYMTLGEILLASHAFALVEATGAPEANNTLDQEDGSINRIPKS